MVVLLVAGLFFNYMQFLQYWQETDLLAQEKQALDAVNDRLLAMVELKKQNAQMEADLEILSQLLPVNPLEDQLIVDFQSGADLSDMKLVQVRYGERIEHEGFVEMPVNILFEGNYHELLHFLDYLQVYERAVRVDELRMDELEDKMSVSIQASAFYAAE
jgi:type IV pilus assembly protein PilO